MLKQPLNNYKSSISSNFKLFYWLSFKNSFYVKIVERKNHEKGQKKITSKH